jgi:hypothetical protein
MQREKMRARGCRIKKAEECAAHAAWAFWAEFHRHGGDTAHFDEHGEDVPASYIEVCTAFGVIARPAHLPVNLRYAPIT